MIAIIIELFQSRRGGHAEQVHDVVFVELAVARMRYQRVAQREGPVGPVTTSTTTATRRRDPLRGRRLGDRLHLVVR